MLPGSGYPQSVSSLRSPVRRFVSGPYQSHPAFDNVSGYMDVLVTTVSKIDLNVNQQPPRHRTRLHHQNSNAGS